MTVSSETRLVTYVGNGSTKVFAYPFTVYVDTHLQVALQTVSTGIVDAPLSSSLYSVTGIGVDGGGNVTYPLTGPAIDSTKRIVIYRDVPYTQDTGLTNQGRLYLESIETQLDLVVMMAQQLAEQLSRALIVNPTETPPDISEIVAAEAYALAASASASAAAASQSAAASSEAGAAAAATTVCNALLATLNDLAGLVAATGDLIIGNAANDWTTLAVGSTGQALVVSGGKPAWGNRVGRIVRTVVSTPGTYTNGWTKASTLVAMEVEVIGGGGGGGGAQGNASGANAGTGGSGGGYAKKLYLASDLAATETYVVGALGAGGSAGANNGSNGGNSTFKGLTGNGGTGGAGRTATSANAFPGVVGGTGTGGDINVQGRTSGPVRVVGSTNYIDSWGGDSMLGTGGLAPDLAPLAGNAGSGFGAGGSGAVVSTASSSAFAGGNGTVGAVIFTEYHTS